MKKTIIASKNLKKLGFQQVIATLDTSECTINHETYYEGKISKKETTYYEDYNILNILWNINIKYYQENGYTIIMI